jgi:hypothetical protein
MLQLICAILQLILENEKWRQTPTSLDCPQAVPNPTRSSAEKTIEREQHSIFLQTRLLCEEFLVEMGRIRVYGTDLTDESFLNDALGPVQQVGLRFLL